MKICSWCGESFKPSRAGRDQKCCSQKCRRARNRDGAVPFVKRGIAYVPLAGGKEHVILDESDLEKVSAFAWHLHSAGYAVATRSQEQPLDNRQTNLRVATGSQNIANSKLRKDSTSGYKGVSWHKHSGLWRARIHVQKREISLGYFETPEKAAEAYDVAALEQFGEYARVNFPKERA